jgi:hypothetical protein
MYREMVKATTALFDRHRIIPHRDPKEKKFSKV